MILQLRSQQEEPEKMHWPYRWGFLELEGAKVRSSIGFFRDETHPIEL
jgi:hypothetical protein